MNRSVNKKHEKVYSLPLQLSQLSPILAANKTKEDRRPGQSISGWQKSYAIDEECEIYDRS